MSQALSVEVLPPLPKGVTKKQMRLAALLPRAESAYQALIQAGYRPATARSDALTIREAPGVKRAAEAIAASQADRARGIVGKGVAALESANISDLTSLEKLQFGLKAVEVGHNLGENLERAGSADAWKQRLRRACRLMARLTELRLRATQDVVFPPTTE